MSKGPNSKATDASYTLYNASSIVDPADNEIYILFSGSHSSGKAYTGSTLYMAAYYKNITFEYSTYVSHYSFDEAYHTMPAADITAHFAGEVDTFAKALENAMKAALA